MVELHPLHELLLEAGMWFKKLISSLERDTNFEMERFEGVLHLGHSKSASDCEIGRNNSNLW